MEVENMKRKGLLFWLSDFFDAVNDIFVRKV